MDGLEKSLTATEFKILYLLMSNPGRFFSADSDSGRLGNIGGVSGNSYLGEQNKIYTYSLFGCKIKVYLTHTGVYQ